MSTFILLVAIVRISPSHASQDFLPIVKANCSIATVWFQDPMSSSEKPKETQEIEEYDEPDEW